MTKIANMLGSSVAAQGQSNTLEDTVRSTLIGQPFEFANTHSTVPPDCHSTVHTKR